MGSDNSSVNFSLKSNASIQIGIYFFILAYAIKNILNGFLVDDNPIGMMSAEIIEILCFSLIFITILLSIIALFFKSRRASRKNKVPFWNAKTKNISFKVFILISLSLLSIATFTKIGKINFIAPISFIFYAIILFFVKRPERKNIIVLSLLCLLLAITCFFIPSYWYSSIAILAISHIAYGVVVRD